MIWNILGIQPTDDKKAITSAYRNKLLQVHPEEKPEEFKALRSAYEQAMQEADKLHQPVEQDESPMGLWKAQLKGLYNDFARRIDPDQWRQLLDTDLCLSLDTRPETEDALIRFLMERYYLPRAVWQVLDETFDWEARLEELYESYPRDFVDHVILPGIHGDPALPYDLYTPGVDGEACDALRRLYFQTRNAPNEERGPMLEQLRSLPERHPYADALAYAYQLLTDPEAGRAGLRQLADAYPTDPMLNMALIDACENDWTLAESLADRVLTEHPQHRAFRRLKAQCLANRGEYEEAKEIVFGLIRLSAGDQLQANQLQTLIQGWNKELVTSYEAILASQPDDSATARKLCWCYIQNEDYENARRIAPRVREDRECPFDYHNLMAKLAYASEELDEALVHFEQINSMLAEAETDPAHPARKHLNRKAEFLQIAGVCCLRTDRQDRATELYAAAMEAAPEDLGVLDNMGRLLNYRKDYEGAVEVYRRICRTAPGSYHGFLMLALNLYELRRDREAFDAINEALNLEGSDLTVYVTKMRILLRNGVWDQVREMIEFLTKAGVGDTAAVRWCKGMLAELADEDVKTALSEYNTIVQLMEQGEGLPWEADVYYRIALLTARDLDMRKTEDRGTMMSMLEKCLTVDSEHEDALDYKAWLLRRDKKLDEALEIYRALEAKPVHSLNAELGIAQVYYDRLESDADQALKYYRKLLQHRETPDYHFFAGTCLRYMHQWEEAAKHFAREQEIAPEDVDGYNGMAYVLEAQGRYGEALEQMDKAIEAVLGKEDKYSWLFNHKAQILRRQGKLQEAYDLLTMAAMSHGAKGCHETRFETCCQFGDWNLARTALGQWIKTVGSDASNAEASVMLQLYQGKMMKAAMAFASAVKHLNDYRQDEIQMTVAGLEGNPKRSLDVWSKRYLKEKASTRTVGCLAQAQWENGLWEEAKKTAALLLDLLDKKLAGFTVDEALYRTQRVRPLAILGRFEEARAELERARSLPLCAGCVYGSCKDADVFEAEMEEIAGNEARAMELFRLGAEKWPDELDMATGMARLKKKGKKKL